jgi:signal transduction histidine kinase
LERISNPLKINSMKNDNTLVEKFIYSCSHDLRSPVSSIQGLVRIADYYPHHEEIGKCLDMIESCTHKMDNLIRRLEEYLVNNNYSVNTTITNANELIQKVESLFRKQLDAYLITLNANINVDGNWMIDEKIVFKILQYLVTNSIGFHDPEKSERMIEISIHADQTGSIIEIIDNGVGIPSDMVAKVFDVFFKASKTSMGAGMGLFLAKSLTEKAGGCISCQSSEGEGTCIRLCFPK